MHCMGQDRKSTRWSSHVGQPFRSDSKECFIVVVEFITGRGGRREGHVNIHLLDGGTGDWSTSPSAAHEAMIL